MSDERTCATCEHWESPEADAMWGDWMSYPEEDAGRWGVCQLIDLPGYGEQTALSAYVQDGSDYKATLHARADFGCNLHAPSPDPTMEQQ